MVAPSFSGDLPRSLFINVFGTVESGREAGRKEGRDIFLFWRTLASRLRRYVGQRAYIFLRGRFTGNVNGISDWSCRVPLSVYIAKVRRYLSPIFLFSLLSLSPFRDLTYDTSPRSSWSFLEQSDRSIARNFETYIEKVKIPVSFPFLLSIQIGVGWNK